MKRETIGALQGHAATLHAAWLRCTTILIVVLAVVLFSGLVLAEPWLPAGLPVAAILLTLAGVSAFPVRTHCLSMLHAIETHLGIKDPLAPWVGISLAIMATTAICIGVLVSVSTLRGEVLGYRPIMLASTLLIGFIAAAHYCPMRHWYEALAGDDNPID